MTALLIASAFEFSTEDLHVKPLGEEDEELYLHLYTSERVMRFITTPLSLQQAKASFEHALAQNKLSCGNRLFLTTRPINSDKAVALCCISDFDRKNEIVEIGNMVSPLAQGKQYAQQATVALMHHVQHVLDVHHFTMEIHEKNLAALRAARLLGFRPCEGQNNMFYLHKQKCAF